MLLRDLNAEEGENEPAVARHTSKKNPAVAPAPAFRGIFE